MLLKLRIILNFIKLPAYVCSIDVFLPYTEHALPGGNFSKFVLANFYKVWCYLADLITKVIATKNRLNCVKLTIKRSAFDTYSTLCEIKKALFELCSSVFAGFCILDCKTIIHRFESGRRLHFTTIINRASKHSWRPFFFFFAINISLSP